MAMFSIATWGPAKTAGRYALTALGSGIAVLGAVGLMSQTDAATATEAIKNIATSLGTIATSVATLAGIGATVYATVRGTFNSTADQQKISVAAQPNTMVLTTTPQSSDAAVANKVASLPEVAEVLSTAHVAASTPSEKVVATPTV